MADVLLTFQYDHIIGGPMYARIHVMYDSILTYHTGNESTVSTFDIISNSGGHNRITFTWDAVAFLALNQTVSVPFAWDIAFYAHILVHMDVDAVEYDFSKYASIIFSWDISDAFQYLVHMENDEVVLGEPTDAPRQRQWLYSYSVAEVYHLGLLFQWAMFAGGQGMCQFSRDNISFNYFILVLQPSVYISYSATLIDTLTSEEQTVTGQSELEIMQTFVSTISPGPDSTYQVDINTMEQNYSQTNTEITYRYTSWRYLQNADVQYRAEPKVNILTSVSSPSTYEVTMSAIWPYLNIEGLISNYALLPENNGDFFDLGIWLSNTLAVDTSEPPLLTIPWDSGTTNYAAHVPKQENMSFIAIAPIRRFPVEHIGFLTITPVPT